MKIDRDKKCPRKFRIMLAKSSIFKCAQVIKDPDPIYLQSSDCLEKDTWPEAIQIFWKLYGL